MGQNVPKHAKKELKKQEVSEWNRHYEPSCLNYTE